MSPKTKTLIVDDEPLARERIRSLLADDHDIEIVGECSDGQEAVQAIRELSPKLLFLDIQMPELDGFDVVETIGADKMPITIFVTAFDQFALKAFEAHALDYLLKPFDRERFRKALDRAKAACNRVDDADVSQRLLSLLGDLKPGSPPLERLVVKSSGRVFFVQVDEIDWIEAAGNYLRIHVGPDEHLLRETMNSIESKLDPNLFARIHRSTIVNVSRIQELQPMFHGDYSVILKNGTQLTLSRGYREKLQDRLGVSL